MSAPKVNKQEFLRIAQANAQNAIKEYIVDYDNRITEILNKDKTLEDWLSGGVELVRQAIKGAVQGYYGFQGTFITLLAGLVNDTINVFDNLINNEGDVLKDVTDIFVNPALHLLEGATISAMSIMANVERLFDPDSNQAKWYDENMGRFQMTRNVFNRIRVDGIEKVIEDTYKATRDPYSTDLNNAPWFDPDDYYKNKAEERWNPNVKLFLEEFSYHNAKQSEEVSENFSQIVTLELGQRGAEAFAGSKTFGFLSDISSSIGNILLTHQIGKIAAHYNLTAPQIETLTSAYFASTVFGNAFQEAINNGASINDAYTYAVGNAALETAMENVGGITPSGLLPKKVLDSRIYKRMLGSSFNQILKSAISEGLEEVGSEFGSSGFQMYTNPDNTLERVDNTDFFESVGFAFLGGFVSGGFLSSGNVLEFGKTADSKVTRYVKHLDKVVEVYGEDIALEQLKDDLSNVTKALNNPRAKGVIETEAGVKYIGKMTLNDKRKFISTYGLKDVIIEENGVFKINEENVNKDIFKNRIYQETKNDKGETVYEEVVVNDEYAVNGATRSENISSVTRIGENQYQIITPVKLENQNEQGKRILQIANKRNVKLAVYESNDTADSAVYGRDNGIIYINQNSKEIADMSYEQLEEFILRHELVHHLKTVNPKLYKEIAKQVFDFVDIKISQGDIKVEYKNKQVGEYLESKGFSKILKDAYNDYKESSRIIKRRKKESKQEANKRRAKENERMKRIMQEEVVAYFAENMYSGGKFLDMLSLGKKNALSMFKKNLEQNKALKEIAQKDKKVYRKLKTLRNRLDSAIKASTMRKETMAHFLVNIITEPEGYDFSDLFKKEFLENHSVEELLTALFADPESDTIEIDGKTYELSEVVNYNYDENVNPKRYKNVDSTTETFKYNPDKIDDYITMLEDFSEKATDLVVDNVKNARFLAESTKLLKENKPIKDTALFEYLKSMKRKLAVAEMLLDDLYSDAKEITDTKLPEGLEYDENFVSTAKEKLELLAELHGMKAFVEGENKAAEKTVKKTKRVFFENDTARATFNSLRVIVRYMNEKTAYKGFSNHARADNYPEPCAACTFNVTKGKDRKMEADAIKNVINTIIGLKGWNDAYYAETYFGNTDSSKFEIVIYTYDSYVDKLVENAKKKEEDRKKLLEEKQKLESEGIPDGTLFQQERLYNHKKMARKFVNDIAGVLNKKGIDLKNVNVIDVNAGNGIFLDVFKEYGIKNYEGYDINPERKDIKTQDFLKLNKEYDKNSAIIGNPPFSDDNITNFINHGFTMSPIVAFILPASYDTSFQKQSKIADGKKLIFSKKMGIQSFKVSGETRPIKTVAQIWVDGSDARFKNDTDLRLTERKKSKSEDFKTLVLNGNPDKFERARTISFKDFDFAVHRSGNVDFNRKYTSYDDLRPNGEYILIKANSPEALKILNSIDYKELSKKSGNTRPGFNAYDIVDAYNEAKEDAYDTDSEEYDFVPKRKSKKQYTPIDPNQSIIIDELVGAEDFIKDLLLSDGKTYITSQRNFIFNSKFKNKLKLNGKIYSSAKHAVSAIRDFTAVNLVEKGKIDHVAELSELSRYARIVHETLKYSKVSYVLYVPKNKKSKTAGFSLSGQGSPNVIFINASRINSLKYATNVIVHEITHELFKTNALDVTRFARHYADLLFKYDPVTKKVTPTEVWDSFIAESGFNTAERFFDYIVNEYGSDFKNITSIEALYELFANPTKHSIDVLNELTAQITGFVFSDVNTFKQTIKSNHNSFLDFYNIYDNMVKNANDKNLRGLLKLMFEKFNDIFNDNIEKIKKIFPKDSGFSYYQINKFIEEFSDGAFTTKAKLLAEFVREKITNSRGIATATVENIIYSASIFGKKITEAINVYGKIKDEFSNFKNNIDFLLSGADEIFEMSSKNAPIFKLHSEIKKLKKNVTVDNISKAKIRELIDAITAFSDAYQNLDEKIIEMFGLPSQNSVVSLCEKSLLELNKSLKAIKKGDFDTAFKLYNKHTDKLVKGLEAVDDVRKVFAKRNKDDVYANIIVLMKSYRQATVDNIVTSISSKVENKINAILNSSTRQKQSRLNDRILALRSEMINLINAIKNNAFNMAKMKDEVTVILDRIKAFVEGSGSITLYNNNGVALREVTVMVGEADNQTNILTADELEFLNNELKKIYMQFASLFQKKDILVNRFDDVAGRNFIKFNQNIIGNCLARILDAYQTQYKSVFSKIGETLDAYCSRIINQVLGLDKQLKVKLLTATSNILTPQEFLKTYRDLLKGRVDFFDDFYREYVAANSRRQKITREFYEAYTHFNKHHKDYQKYSFEKIDVDPSVLLTMSEAEFIKVEKEVDKIFENREEEIRNLRLKVDDNKGRREELTEKIALKKKELKLLGDRDSQRTNIKNDIKKFEAEKKALAKSTLALNKKIKDLNSTKVLDKKQALKQALTEWHLENESKNLNKQLKISRGNLISLYMSVKRELEMAEIYEENNIDGIYPTNHFRFSNFVYMFDNELLLKKGYKKAQEDMDSFVITAFTKEALLEYIEEKLLTSKDREIIQFANERFDSNYEYLDEVYFEKYGVHLPKQNWYIPFASSTSDYVRDLKTKLANRINLGVPDGLVLETTLGATLPLRIENIFGAIQGHTTNTANYSLERLITDFQNLRVNKTEGFDLDSLFSGKRSMIGQNNGVFEKIEGFLVNILRYSDLTEFQWEKIARKVLRRSSGAILASPTVVLKQGISIITISGKFKMNPAVLVKNIVYCMANRKIHKWLKKNNDNFFWRVLFGGDPALADSIMPTFYQRFKNFADKITNIANLPSNFIDAAILEGAFKTIVDEIRKQDPSLTQEQAFEKANEAGGKFEEVLLFGVANTDVAYRSNFSNSQKLTAQIASRFMSENIMQISGLVRALTLMKNKIKGSTEEFARLLAQFIAGGILASFISKTYRDVSGFEKSENEAFEFWINDVLWGNIVGSIPIVNQISQALQWDIETGIRLGYDFKMPIISEVTQLVQIGSTLSNGKNIERKVIKMLEVISSIWGIPLKNFNRSISTISRLIGKRGNKEAMWLYRFYNNKSKAEGLNEAIKTSNTKQIQVYTAERFSNIRVQNEIVKLLANNPEEKLNLYSVDTFRKKKEDGTYEEYKIPEKTREKYFILAQRSLQKLMSLSSYRKLKDPEKIKAIQRVINYYYNCIKKDVLKEKFDMMSVEAVAERAASYGK